MAGAAAIEPERERPLGVAAIVLSLHGQASLLLNDLRPDESVEQFLENQTLSGQAIFTAITTHRLLAITGFIRPRVRTVSLPLTGTLLPRVGGFPESPSGKPRTVRRPIASGYATCGSGDAARE